MYLLVKPYKPSVISSINMTIQKKGLFCHYRTAGSLRTTYFQADDKSFQQKDRRMA
jgi:hypothetical protein